MIDRHQAEKVVAAVPAEALPFRANARDDAKPLGDAEPAQGPEECCDRARLERLGDPGEVLDRRVLRPFGPDHRLLAPRTERLRLEAHALSVASEAKRDPR